MVVKRLFDLLPNQRFARKIEDPGETEITSKAWASGACRHGGVLGFRNSSEEFPNSSRLVNQYIRNRLGT